MKYLGRVGESFNSLLPVLVVLLVLYNAWIWVMQIHLTTRGQLGSGYILNAFFLILVWSVVLVRTSYRRRRPVVTIVLLLYVLSLLVQYFSYFYWSYGTPQNFSVSLTHLDSIYFSIGTLTTAGTGSITAISQTSRGFQTAQMILDFSIVIVVIGFVVARLSAGQRKLSKV